jgi:outer membrane PBP1 activator LpoA protein
MTLRFVSRRRSLGLLVRAVGAAASASAFSALAQGAASGIGAESFGVPSDNRERIGSGPPRIALLVPPTNGVYRRATLALVDGVRAAHARDGAGFSVEVIETNESGDELRLICETLAGREFGLAIGPLTRNAVTSLAQTGSPPLPVLVLNNPDGVFPPAGMSVFGLAIENEAEHAASYAYRDALEFQQARRPRAALIHDGSPVSLRAVNAFIQRWYASGGEYYEAVRADAAAASLIAELLRGIDADVHFVAMSPAGAATVKAVLGQAGRVYGTSLLNSGALPSFGDADRRAPVIRSPELEGVRLVVMPWQAQPDHPAVMSYPRQRELNVELQKLYALGIDALRLAIPMMAGASRVDLDGVTGHLRLDLQRDPRVDRLPLLAEYREGVLVPVVPR